MYLMQNKLITEQQKRFDEQALEYNSHHNDPYSQAYRNRFIRSRLFNFSLKNFEVLDAMSASGTETGFLIQQGAKVIGLDISFENTKMYQQIWGLPCQNESIHQTSFEDNFFDVVYVCGGLHHILPILSETLTEIHRILKPQGFFCFVEPNQDTWLNKVRILWYKFDRRFGADESAISYNKQLKSFLKLGFKELSYQTGGNIAYLLISQSVIFKISLPLKKRLLGPIFFLENLLEKMPGCPQLFFCVVWQKL
jgi:SAM-dependent methyltransferase